MSEVKSWKALETRFVSALQLERRPVAVTYLETAPAGVEKFEGSEPSGCSFWRLAADGRSFLYRAGGSFQLRSGSIHAQHHAFAGTRTGNGHHAENDVRSGLRETGRSAANSTTGESAGSRCVLAAGRCAGRLLMWSLFACKPRSAMLLNEAANHAGVASGAPALGRPTCMALPASLQHGAIFSLGCIGNRVYTGLGEDEMYCVVRGKDVEAIADALEVVDQRECRAERVRERPAPKAVNGVSFRPIATAWLNSTPRQSVARSA